MKTKITISIDMPKPKSLRNEYQHPTLREKVEQYISDVDSNMKDSNYQWNYLKCVYNKLCSAPRLNEEISYILSILEPVILKYGETDVKDTAEVKAENMNRYYK